MRGEGPKGREQIAPTVQCECRPRRLVVISKSDVLSTALAKLSIAETVAIVIGPETSTTEAIAFVRDSGVPGDCLVVDDTIVLRDMPDGALQGGPHLVNCLRLTPMAGYFRTLPIVLISADDERAFIRRSLDNILLFAPGCTVIRIPECVRRLRAALCSAREFPSLEVMESAIRRFVIFTEGDERARAHAANNRIGIPDFLLAFGGVQPAPKSTLRSKNDAAMELWKQKLAFLSPRPPSRVLPSTESFEDCVRLCRPHNFLLVDDEHRLGWSYGLHQGITGAGAARKFFLRDDALMETEDGRLTIIDQQDAAVGLVREFKERRDRALEAWSRAQAKVVEKNGWDMVQVFARAQRGGGFRAAGAALTEALLGPLTTTTTELEVTFPWSVAFVDVRLEQPKDEGRPLSEVSGLVVLETISSLLPEVQVIMMTGSEKVLSAARARELGASGYWIKSVSSADDLRTLITNTLDGSSLGALWMGILQAQAQSELCGLSITEGRIARRSIGKGDPGRALIEMNLREAFTILKQARARGVSPVGPPDEQIILRLGMIQECQFPEDQRKTAFELSREQLSLDQVRLRRMRNTIVHASLNRSVSVPGGTPVGKLRVAATLMGRVISWLLNGDCGEARPLGEA